MEPVESLKAALDALDEHRERVLNDAGLYPITSYGWLDADSVDPKYAGHAIWQTCPPSEPDWKAMFEGALPDQEPTNIQVQLVRSGEDFSAAMLMARYSAGMAFCSNHALDAYQIDDDYWLHIATSFLWLGIASDRIRDYFTLACFGVTGDKFAFNNGDPWGTPFSRAKARDEEEIARLARLAPLGEALQEFRKHRHHVTHKIASRAAQRSHDILTEQQRRARNLTPFPVPVDLSSEEFQKAQASTSPRDERDRNLHDVMCWYECLAEASNVIFELEYYRRREPGAG